MTTTRRAHGYTLLEIVIALALLALMSALAYRGLQSVLDAQARLEREARLWRDVAGAFTVIQQSLAVAADRPVRAHDGGVAPAFAGSAGSADSRGTAFFAMTRTGFPGHEGALADWQRVEYRFNAGRLEQLLWPVLDQSTSSVPHTASLLEGVARLDLRFVARDGSARAAWPPQGVRAPALPAAVEMTIELASGERVMRLFALP